MARRRVAAADGAAALAAVFRVENGTSAGARADRKTVAMAVRYALEELAERAPGNSVEVRVPPFGVTQCIEGPRHTRGTPPNVVETEAATWLALVTGRTGWDTAVQEGKVSASGQRASLVAWLPLFAAPAAPPPAP